MNQLGDNIKHHKEDTEVVIAASKEAGLDVNTKKTKYMVSCQNAGQNHNINIAKRVFESVAKFRYNSNR
jgi:hypothetical protein